VAGAIRLLVVDDSPDDAELVSVELRAAGLTVEYHRVETAQAMNEALLRGRWDAIIADYKMPGFGCLEALQLIQQRDVDLPFIVVSGAIGEETAVEAMRAGAHDYVLKQNLTRLPAAVLRELREAHIRQERRQAIDAIRDLARRSAFLAEASSRLGGSLDYDETLTRAARVALPEAADWCLLTTETGGGFSAVVGHPDGEREAWARGELARCAPDPFAVRGAVQVIRTGQAESTSIDTVLISTARGEAAALVRALGYHSGVCLPLVARGRTMGALTFVRASAQRPFEPRDLGLAEELAGRAAIALENAALYREACEAVRARDEFLSVASHELNTPLATLTLQLDEILLPPGGSSEQEARERGMVLARRQVERLSRLVWNLLDVSRIAAGQIHLWRSEIDLTAITREVVAQFAAELSRAGCRVQIDAPRPVLGRWDPLRIEQVIANLLSNACKYGAGKPIEIQVGEEHGRARLSVQDHGIGIPAADRDRIFERFERAASRRHYGGLGLGLYISRQVVQAHAGAIRVQSQTGEGSTFIVDLPLQPASRELSDAADALRA
jgi:signal transduction histidine kinase/FixJ family two-component response regulator